MIGSVKDALAAYARIAAAEKIIRDEQARLHSWLRDEASRIGEETGTAAAFKTPTGTAQWTQPTYRVVVDDAAAFGTWCLSAGHPARKRTEIDCSILQRDLDAESHGLLNHVSLSGLLDALREGGYLREAWSLSDVLLEEMTSWPERHGEIVSPDGEIVPGVRRVAKSNPVFRVTPTGDAVKQAQAELRVAMGRALALPAGPLAVDEGPEAA